MFCGSRCLCKLACGRKGTNAAQSCFVGTGCRMRTHSKRCTIGEFAACNVCSGCVVASSANSKPARCTSRGKCLPGVFLLSCLSMTTRACAAGGARGGTCVSRGFLNGNRFMALTNVLRRGGGVCDTTIPVNLDRCNKGTGKKR